MLSTSPRAGSSPFDFPAFLPFVPVSSIIPQPNQSLSSGGSQDPAEAPPTAVSHIPKIDIGEILRAVRRRLWIVIVFMVLATAGAIYYIKTLPILYTSRGAIYIKTHAPQIFENDSLNGNESNDLEQMKTVEQGLLSSTVLLKVAEVHKLAEDPIYGAAGTDPQSLLETMYGRISVELRKGTRLIDINVEDTDPERAARLVTSIVDEYEAWKEGGRAELNIKASAELASEEVRIREKMEESAARMKGFRDLHPVLGLTGDQQRIFSSKLEALTRELSTATTERLKLESQYRELGTNTAEAKGTATLAAKGVRGGLAIDFERQIAAKKADFAVLKERYLHKHPLYIEAQTELERLEKSLAEVVGDAEESLEQELAAVRSREKELELMVAQAKDGALDDEQLREEYATLTKDAEIDRSLHSQVATRLQVTKIGSAMNWSFLRWDERPFSASKPSSPAKKALAAAGLFLGGLAGFFLALLFELIDPKVREASAVERKLKMPKLASLPAYNRQVVSDLSVDAVAPEQLNRPAHLARYTFTPRDESEQMQTLMFTSPFDNDGKTFCALKCARTLVRQGYRTLVIDADFDSQGLSRAYSQQRPGRHGLSAYLIGEAEAAEVLFETGLAGLWFLPTGQVEGDSGELLASPAFRRLLEAIEPMFDRVIIDVASIMKEDDVQAIARHVGATYLVAQKGKGKYRDLKESCEVLRSSGAAVAGFIWNEGGRRSRRADRGPVIDPISFPRQVEVEASTTNVTPVSAPEAGRAVS